MFAGIFIGNYAKNMTSKENTVAGAWTRRYWEQRLQDPVGFYIQCDTKVEARRADIAVIGRTKKQVKIVDATIPGD